MRLHALSILCLLLAAAPVGAQPILSEGAALNIASYAFPGLPNGDLAQGGMFALFAQNAGPATLAQTGFPFPTELGGSSIKVTVGGVSVDCLMVFSISSQLAAILPSSTPLGEGALTATYNGQTSNPITIRVVANSFGIFTRNQAGSGPGILQNFVSAVELPTNALNIAAAPAQTVILWGTGLGAVAGDEAAMPLPGDLTALDVEVWVGGVKAVVTYRGRSGCCAGVDQIVFTIPEGVEGCYVPVTLVVNGVPSNTVTISVSADGEVCGDASGLTSAQIIAAEAAGEFRHGRIALSREIERTSTGIPSLPSLDKVTDNGRAVFRRYTFLQLLATQGVGQPISVDGACSVSAFRGIQPSAPDPIDGVPLDAGNAIGLVGPSGMRSLTQNSPGNYAALLGGGGALPGLGDPLYLAPGPYSASNGAGGPQVSAFTALEEVSAPLNWSNIGELGAVTRSSGLTVTWAVPAGGDDLVTITGYSSLPSLGIGAMFRCRQAASAGMFTVSPYVLGALPVSEFDAGLPTGGLTVGTSSTLKTFEAVGLNLGSIRNGIQISRLTAYE